MAMEFTVMFSTVKFIFELNIVSVITERISAATANDPPSEATKLAMLLIDLTRSLTKASYKICNNDLMMEFLYGTHRVTGKLKIHWNIAFSLNPNCSSIICKAHPVT